MMSARGWSVLGAQLLLLCAGAAAASSRKVEMRVDKPRIALGEAVTVTLARPLRASASSLEDIDLKSLEADFEIGDRTRGADGDREEMRLTLFPRHSGRLRLPALLLGTHGSVIEVTQGSAQVPRVWVSLAAEPSNLIVRQSALLGLEVCAEGVLQWRRPTLTSHEGYLLRPLGETEVITTRDGARCTATRWQWAILPTAPGTLKLVPPTLQATKFGTALRFPAPALQLQVQRLPAWLPVDVPVGPVVAQPADESDPAAAVVRQPYALRLLVTGDVAPQVLRDLLVAQLQAHEPWSAYPPEIRPTGDRSVTPQYEVTLYAKPTAAGVLQMPALHLPWFDPESTTMRQTEVPSRRIEVTDPQFAERVRWSSGAAAVVSSLLLALLLWRGQRWRIRRWRLQRRLRHDAVDADTLHALVRGFDLANTARTAATLGEWQARMQAQCRSKDLSALVQQLQALRYAKSPPALTEAVDAVRAWLRSVRPLPMRLGRGRVAA